MNSKAFRRNPGPKPKSASSTFISLHFNKSDEDQLEISYKNDISVTEEMMLKSASDVVSQSNFYIDDKKDINNELETFAEEVSITKLDNTNSVDVSEESSKGNFSRVVKNSQCNVEAKCDNFQCERIEENEGVDAVSTDTALDSELKLSPAIEAAEVVGSDSFNSYINNELEKGKCETFGLKKEMLSSFISLSQSEKHMKNIFPSNLLTDSKTVNILETSNWHKTNVNCSEKSFKDCSHFCYILQNSIILMKYAQNSMKFHIVIAVLACIWAPIPSWLSGFLVGVILSFCLVYWLYKPQTNKKKFYNFNFASSIIAPNSNFQKESQILKGWMNELPSFISYSPERYHVSFTRSVYVRLEDSYLRLSFPQKNIPKRAMFNEPRYEMQFIYQHHYDITDAIVELLPQRLSNKRFWSKKYPICLRIPNSKGALLSKSLEGNSVEGSFSAKTNKKNSRRKFMPRINENNEIVLYLFSRTDHDKSLWFSRFLKASTLKMKGSKSSTLCTRPTEHESFKNRTMSVDFAYLQDLSSELQGEDEVEDNFVNISLNKQQTFEMYMSALLAPLYAEHPFAMCQLKKEKKDSTNIREGKSQSSLRWLNVLIGRLFFDFLVEDVWVQHVSAKIQKKLNRIKLPFFLTELTVKDINLGSALPKIHYASDPSLDERGLWIDMDVSYNGSFHMTLETKLNLDRFKADSETLFTTSGQNQVFEQTKSSVYDSDEDSLESSSDDECLFPETTEPGSLSQGSQPGSKSKKILKLMDKLAQSSYFQHAAKNKYVKRAMNDISNTPLILTVEVQWLTGTLAINIPPWPTDRVWYGFRTNPSLSITAHPKLGQHVVTFTQITEWIEKKLTSEFQKVLVMPNMDDLIIPIMKPSNDIT